MRGIHIANEKRRDAEVAFESKYEPKKMRTVLKDGKDKTNIRVLKATVGMDEQALARQFGEWPDVADAIISGDPELDIEITGKILNRTHRLWVDSNENIAYRVNLFRTIFNPDGTEKERKDVNKLPGNVNKEFPLRWSGRYFPRKDIIRQFVFTRSYQIYHINGATFDFLFNMAKDLDDKDAMVMIGGGEKGSDPILLSRGGQPYRGFLEGRITNDRYVLIMHLTDIELKSPRRQEEQLG